MEHVDAERRQFLRMTETPVPRLVSTLAAPTILSMLITTFYNLADTFFVARLGTSAAGAVGIVFAMMALVQAMGFMIGIGCGSQVSRSLGRRDRDTADRFASSAFAFSLLLGSVLAVFGLTFNAMLMRLLGATSTILPYAKEYARWIFYGTAFNCASFVLNNILRAEGRTVLSLAGLGFGGLLNIALDPLFIFTFGLGIAGAAIATLVSQCVSFSILLSFFLTGKSITRLSFRNISRRISVYLEILKIGSSSFCRQGLAGLSTVALNVAAGSYGDAAVAAMSIVGRIFHFLLSALIGFGQGFQPVAGFNYGARRFDRVAEAYGFTVKTGTVFLTVVGVVGWWLAPEVIRLFQSDDPQVVVIGTIAFRAQCLALPLQPTVVLANMLFQSTGRAFRALFISATRQGIYFLPLILILPRFYGLGGVEYTQPLSDLMAFLSSIPFLWSFFRELRGAGTVAEGSAVGGAVPQPAGSR